MGILTNPFRYFIVPTTNQVHMDHASGPYSISNKNQLIVNFLTHLQGGKYEFAYRKNDYILYSMSSISDRFFLLKLAKKKMIDLHIAGEDDVEDVTTPDYPYVYILVDVKYQILLIQFKNGVFSSSESTSKIMAYIFNQVSQIHHYEVSLNPLLKKDHFWKSIGSAERIIEAEFTLESPNLFDGIINIESTLKKIKKRYNNSRTSFKFTNDNDSLSMNQNNEELNSTLEYIGNGGGKWRLTVIEGGKKEPKESNEHIQKIVLDDNVENEMVEDYKKIETYINQVEDVMKNEENSN